MSVPHALEAQRERGERFALLHGRVNTLGRRIAQQTQRFARRSSWIGNQRANRFKPRNPSPASRMNGLAKIAASGSLSRRAKPFLPRPVKRNRRDFLYR